MINAGDELGRSQGGNNNAYCQDNETSWIDWDLEPWQEDLLATTRHVARVRRDLPALRQRVWALGRQVHDDGTRDMEWYAADGHLMGHRWDDPGVRVVQMYVAGRLAGAASALVVVNGGREETEVTLPAAPGLTAYRLLWDSAWERPQPDAVEHAPGPVTVAADEPAGLRRLRHHLSAPTRSRVENTPRPGSGWRRVLYSRPLWSGRGGRVGGVRGVRRVGGHGIRRRRQPAGAVDAVQQHDARRCR